MGMFYGHNQVKREPLSGLGYGGEGGVRCGSAVRVYLEWLYFSCGVEGYGYYCVGYVFRIVDGVCGFWVGECVP